MEDEANAKPAPDPAAMAFDGLKAEVITLRLAVQQLSAIPMALDIPDYTDSLAEIRKGMMGLVSHYRELTKRPALAVTPDELAAQIVAASEKARAAERQSLQSAEATFVSLGRELTGFVESARTADRQNKWLAAMLALGCAVGIAFVAIWLRLL
jgi:uncharacterized protein HemX